MSRRNLLSAITLSSGEGSIFPIHLNLQEISNEEYRLDPTPESIALCDYFVANAVFNGASHWELELNPGELYIDGIEVQHLDCEGYADRLGTPFGTWYPCHERYNNSFLEFEIYYKDDSLYPKGTFRVYNDN